LNLTCEEGLDILDPLGGGGNWDERSFRTRQLEFHEYLNKMSETNLAGGWFDPPIGRAVFIASFVESGLCMVGVWGGGLKKIFHNLPREVDKKDFKGGGGG